LAATLRARAGRVEAGIGAWAEIIERVGSTAVPGLDAKPIVNVLVGLRDIRDAQRCVRPLGALGYSERLLGSLRLRRAAGRVLKRHTRRGLRGENLPPTDFTPVSAYGSDDQYAYDPIDTSDSGTTQVREMEDEYTAAFGRKDAKALAALLAEEVTLVTEWGDVVQGRAEIERMLASVFPGTPDKLEIESTPAHARAIADDVIVSHGTLHKIGAWCAGEDKLSYTRVLGAAGRGVADLGDPGRTSELDAGPQGESNAPGREDELVRACCG